MILTHEQRKALAAGDQVRVLAAAGTGKTAILVERAATWAEAHGGSGITAMTFTRRAAAELTDRLAARGVALSFIGTVHAFCFLSLWRWGHRYTLLDEMEMEIVAAYVIETHNMRSVTAPKRLVKSVIGERPVKLNKAEQAATEQLRSYMRQQGLLYVGDVPYKWLSLAGKEPRFVETFRAGARAVLWDEYQDTNDTDRKILEVLAPERVFIIGDPSQAIYGFRGSSATYLLSHDAPPVNLTINWRSGPQIVELGNGFRSHMWAIPGVKEPATVKVQATDEHDTGRRIAAIAAHTRPLHVLCRTNYELKRLADEIEECSDLRVWLVSSKYDRFNAPHWRAIFWLCQWRLHPDRAWVRRLAHKLLEAVGYWQSMPKPPETAQDAVDLLRLHVTDDVDKLELSAFDFCAWYQARDLQEQLPTDAHEAPDVVLMTVHAAKGLQFDNVAVVASNMPLRGQDPEEERNVFYVAVTRARRTLRVLGSGVFWAKCEREVR